MDHDFEPTRDAALARMEAFLVQAGPDYQRRRNHVGPRGSHDNVSRLSPYLRYRLLTEQELLGRVLERLGPVQGRCFIDEVLWRSYWKGHLRHYPSLYLGYVQSREELAATAPPGYARALLGQTGIACFDDWADELRDTGYLHNHARMWFASIWVFTLELPWQLGAAFFEEHLVDADPASNTLSWRWVAGLHTPGKIYLASEHNIATYTNNRYPENPRLARSPKVPSYVRPAPESDPLAAWRCEADVAAKEGEGLLVMAHDLHPESQWSTPPGPVAIFEPARDAQGPAQRFRQGAVEHTRRRLGRWALGEPVPCLGDLSSLLSWVEQNKLSTLWLSAVPIAQALPLVPMLAQALEERAVSLKLRARAWDRQSWTQAGKGFFTFRKKAGPELLQLAALSPHA